MSTVRRALFLSTGERYFALIGNFALTAIVSRILTPAEIGVSVVGMAIVGLVVTVREFAGSNYLIQDKDCDPSQVRAAFTVMLAATIVVSSALALCAPLAAAAYGDARLVPYLRVVSAALFVETFGQFVLILLRREMRFANVALVSVAATLTSVLVTLTLVILGFSYMSFAWAWLASTAVLSALGIALRRQFWTFRPIFKGWSRIIAFGGYNGGTVLAYRLFETVPYLMLGRMLSMDAAAIYFRSMMICQLPDKIFLAGAASVILPAFSVEVREGRQLKGPYLRGLELVTAFQWPALLVLALLAHPIVDIMLGEQWVEAAPLVQIIALALLFSFSFELNYPVLVAVGAIQDVFYRAVIVFPIAAAIVLVASFVSLQAVAWSMMLIVPFHAFVALSFVCRRIDLRWREIGVSMRSSAIVALATALGPLAMALSVTPRFDLSITEGGIAVVLAAVGWFGSLCLTRHPLLEEIFNVLPSRMRMRLQLAAVSEGR